ncbi:MAG: hypothetical protein ACREL3_03480 [Gemmatimonadales bacterium]
MTRPPPRPVSLHDLRRIADSLTALRGHPIAGATMRSDRRQLRIEMPDNIMLVIGVDLDEGGHPRLEVDVVRPLAEPANQLEVRFESA